MATKNNIQTRVWRGKTSFAKILGDPVLNYSKDGKEWKMDLVLSDKATLKEAKDLGIGDRIKQKQEYLDGAPHITFKQAEFKRNGEPNQPITVVDAAGNAWDPTKLIGNGSTVDVKFVVIDNGPGKKHGVYIRSVRVLELVSYERQEFEPLSEEDEFFDKAKEAEEQAKQKEQDMALLRGVYAGDANGPDISDDDDLNDDLPV